MSTHPDIANSVTSVFTGEKRGIKSRLKEFFFIEKFNNPLGWCLFIVVALLVGYYVAIGSYKVGALLIAGILGTPILLACLTNPKIGVLFILAVSFPLLGVKKYFSSDPPLGLLLDAMLFLMFFGLYIRQIHSRDWKFAQSGVSYIVLIWTLFNLMEVLNPSAASRMAWFYTVRGMAGLILLYFIALFAMDRLRYISTVFKLFIGLSLAAALYALWQEFMGLNTYELRWLYADEARFKLIFQWGRIRKFSFLSDPTSFGILMAYAFVFSFVFIMGPTVSRGKKLFLCLAMLCILMGMIYSGTRTAYALVPIGLVFYTMLSLRRSMIVFCLIMFAGGPVLMMKSTSNVHIYRIQSAFRPGKDASMQIRLENQKNIQPFIQSHPIGGGLGRVGVWGRRFSPDDPLSEFPPDSGYVRVAVEQGWLGLIIYCGLFFIVLKTGINHYIRVRAPDIKTYYEATLTLFFMLVVANYPQEAIVLLPNSIVAYICMAAIVRLKDFDPNYLKEPTYAQSIYRARLGK